ncbi:hypothetical protein [Thermosulfuriphilus sp.]
MRRQIFFIINGFIHDLATGLWAGFLVCIFLLSTRKTISEVKVFMFWLSLGALALVATTGAIRLKDYRLRGESSLKGRLLWIKHLLLGLVFFGATWGGYLLAFKG